MTRPHADEGSRSEHLDEAAVLVCGRCARVLAGRYLGPGAVDEAADRHAMDVHEGPERTVVIPASTGLAEDEPENLVQIAVRAQRALADGGPGSLVGGPVWDAVSV